MLSNSGLLSAHTWTQRVCFLYLQKSHWKDDRRNKTPICLRMGDGVFTVSREGHECMEVSMKVESQLPHLKIFLFWNNSWVMGSWKKSCTERFLIGSVTGVTLNPGCSTCSVLDNEYNIQARKSASIQATEIVQISSLLHALCVCVYSFITCVYSCN